MKKTESFSNRRNLAGTKPNRFLCKNVHYDAEIMCKNVFYTAEIIRKNVFNPR